jgi:hypothetical protein
LDSKSKQLVAKINVSAMHFLNNFVFIIKHKTYNISFIIPQHKMVETSPKTDGQTKEKVAYQGTVAVTTQYTESLFSSLQFKDSFTELIMRLYMIILL